MNEISSTERLLDLIRNKKRGFVPNIPPVKEHPSIKGKTRLKIENKQRIRKNLNIGVDIGHESLRLIKTEKISDHEWHLIDYQTVPFDRRIGKNSSEFIDFLKTELHRFCGVYKKINVWAIMSAAKVHVRHITIPKVPKNQIEKAVFWTIKRETPFNEKEMVMDYEVLEETLDQGNPKWFVMAYTAPVREVDELKILFNKIGLPLTGISIVPFAVQNIFRTDWIPKSTGTAAYLFIGNDFSRIDIYAKGNLMMTRGIKAGINSMVESLLDVLKSQGHEDTTSGDGENVREIRPEQARNVLFSLSPDSPPLSDGEPGYSMSEEEKFQIILPALERLVRQVERTFEYYDNHIGHDRVDRIYVTSAMNIYRPLIDYVGEQLGIESDLLDAFDHVLSDADEDSGKVNISERISLMPALGMALSDNSYTPNLLFSSREKQQIININRVNRSIFFLLAIATLISGGFFFYQIGTITKKKIDINRLQNQLTRYQPLLKRDDILQMALKSKRHMFSDRDYLERYRALAVIGELSSLTPPNIRLVNLKVDFGAFTSKANESQKQSAPAQNQKSGKTSQAQPAAAKTGSLIIEGIVSGNRSSLESSLAGYLIKLQESLIFKQVAVQSNNVERIKQNDVLRFTINMKAL